MQIRSKTPYFMAAMALTAFFAFSGPVHAEAVASAATVLAAAEQKPELSTFYKLVQQAGFSDALKASGPVTVFAPTNDAFKAVPAATLDKLSSDPELLKTVLAYHVVPGLVKAANVQPNSKLTTLNGAQIAASKAGDFVTVDDALVTEGDLMASNGVVHLIDRVLMPAVKK